MSQKSQNPQDSADALEPLVTQCPNCDTRFRVSETQLQVAGGRVRCGACLTVFDGADFLTLDGELLSANVEDDGLDAVLEEMDTFDEKEDEQESEPFDGNEVVAGLATVASLAESPGVDDSTLDAHEFAAPDLSQLEQLENELLSDLVESQDGEAGSAGDEVSADVVDEQRVVEHEVLEHEAFEPEEQEQDPPEPGILESDNLDAAEDIDELEELAAFAEDLGLEHPPVAGTAESEIETSLDHVAQSASASGQDPGAASAEDWTAEVADDIWDTSADDVGAEVPISLSGVAAGVSASESDEALAELEDDANITTVAEHRATTMDAATQSSVLAAQSSADADLALGHFDDAAYFEGDAELENSRSWFTYALIALAIVALPAQVLWFQYEDWVDDPQYRPLYVSLCSVVGCEVPALIDVSAIEAQRSVGRVNPDSGIRTIDILMVNKANFSQPFPVVEVVFENLQGEQVAVSRLAPGQYLPQSQPADAHMQPRTPVHVSFDVPDPGADATGFSVRFRANS